MTRIEVIFVLSHSRKKKYKNMFIKNQNNKNNNLIN